MPRNPERDARELARRKLNIIKTAFPIFAEKTIESVAMQEIADACEIGIATLYRHYPTKSELVVAVSAWAWDSFLTRTRRQWAGAPMGTGAEDYAFFLDSFYQLYCKHRDLLRFNQFFNVYVQAERMTSEQMQPYGIVIESLGKSFHFAYEKGKKDGTLRTDVSETEMFSASLHLMLAVVTRYAVGLVYDSGIDPKRELLLQKEMLLAQYTKPKQ